MAIKTPNFKVKVMRSKAGLGLFAMEPIPKGKLIIEYVGRVVTGKERDECDNLYIFNVSKKKDIDGSPRWNTARYINHSCRPNAESEIISGRVFIRARRNIMLGEEITYDYGKEYWSDHIKNRGCICVKCKEVRHVLKNKIKKGKSYDVKQQVGRER